MYILSLLYLFLLVRLSDCQIMKQTCISSNSESAVSEDKDVLTQSSVQYSCPGDSDPKTFTKCCNDKECCDGTLLAKALNNNWMLMVTAITVISSCLFLTVLLVICCFWSKCLLYNACRANYDTSNVIVYSLSKEDPTPLMPAECYKGDQNKQCTVKIKKVLDV